jgi:hypothetical protein
VHITRLRVGRAVIQLEYRSLKAVGANSKIDMSNNKPWVPFDGSGNTLSQTAIAPSGSVPKVPELKLPEVGDTVWLQVYPYGGTSVIGDGQHAQAGSSVIVLEVKEIKKVKVVLE